MRVVTLVVLVMGLGCVRSQHAEITLANNPAGADCFATCVQSTSGPEVTQAAVRCVASCPGARLDGGDCDGALACVEYREMRTGLTAVLVIGAVALAFLAFGGAGGGGQ